MNLCNGYLIVVERILIMNKNLWKVNHSRYTYLHNWLKYFFGKSYKCEGSNCSKKCNYYEWANISGEYKKDRSDWIMLCTSCHRRMDYKRNHGNHCKRGHEFTKDNTYIWIKNGRRKCKKCMNDIRRLRYKLKKGIK